MYKIEFCDNYVNDFYYSWGLIETHDSAIKYMNLRIKLNIVLIAISLISIIVLYFLLLSTLKENSKAHILAKSEMLLNISDVAENTLRDSRSIDTVYTKASENSSEFMYKTVLIDADNENNEANIWQKEIIKHFQDNPAQQKYSGIKSDVQGSFMYLANVMKQDNVLIGAKVVSIYEENYQKSISDKLKKFLVSLIIIFLIIVVILNALFHVFMLKPIQKIVTQSRQMSKGQSEENEIIVKGQGELSIIAESFNRMQRSLKAAMLMLNK